MSIQFLSIDSIKKLHQMLIYQFGGLHDIRDKNLLESAVVYPQILNVIGNEQDLCVLAAAYGYHLIKNHSFIDGNKRIGTLAMPTFSKINGQTTRIPNAKLYALAIEIATSKIDEKGITEKLRSYSSLSAS